MATVIDSDPIHVVTAEEVTTVVVTDAVWGNIVGNIADQGDLGTAAVLDAGTGPLNVVQLDATGILPALNGSQLTGLPAQDHGGLLGLADDDHTQYHTDARGDARYSLISHIHVIANVDGLQTALDNKLETSLKGAVNGLAELDASGQVPAEQLPAAVADDEVVEYANYAALPVTGATGKLYVVLDTNDLYRWSGAVYVKVGTSATTADEALSLATARTISLTGDVTGSTSFDGSADVSITATVADNSHNHTLSNITDAGTMASQAADNVNITGGLISGATISNSSAGLSDLSVYGSGAATIKSVEVRGSLSQQWVGIGYGAAAACGVDTTYNTAIGYDAMAATNTGDRNTAVGAKSLLTNQAASDNTGVGYNALGLRTSGNSNVAVGSGAHYGGVSGTGNTVVGATAAYNSSTGGSNVVIGWGAFSSGDSSSNTIVGAYAGSDITTGGKHTIVGRYSGNQGGLDIRTATGYIVLADGDGNPQLYWDGTGWHGGGAPLSTTTGAEVLTNKTISDLTNSVHANSLHTKVHNMTGATIYAGQPLSVSSWESGEDAERVTLANNAVGPANYIAEENIAHGAYGAAIVAGVITGIDTLGTGGGSTYTDDTGGWDEGTILYVNGAGKLTSTEPTSGYSQPIAMVIRAKADGALHVLAAYPKQDAADVRYDASNTVADKIDSLTSSAYTAPEVLKDTTTTGWYDLTAPLTAAGVPVASAPTLASFGPTHTPQREEMSFAVNDYAFCQPFHVNHDIKPNGNALVHIHWSTNGTSTATVKWEFTIMRALGHDQENFATPVVKTVEQAAAGTAWRHMVSEVAIGEALTLAEPDELILVTIRRVTNGGTENSDTVFGLTVDFHYENDRHNTLNRAPNFYGA